MAFVREQDCAGRRSECIPGEQQQGVERFVAVVGQGKRLTGIEQALEVASDRRLIGVKVGPRSRRHPADRRRLEPARARTPAIAAELDVRAREHGVHLVADENRCNEDRAGGQTPFIGTGLDDDHPVPSRLLEPVDDGERSDVDGDAGLSDRCSTTNPSSDGRSTAQKSASRKSRTSSHVTERISDGSLSR